MSALNRLRRLFGQSITMGKRCVVIGMDGLDPTIVQTGIREDWLPNFASLANEGGLSELQTTWMPISPVAWSSFISGCNPGRHGIFDFLHRDPQKYEPYLSVAQQEGPPQSIQVGRYQLPLSSGRTKSGRKGPAFWRETSRQGVQTSVIRCPTSFPPEPVRGKMLSGLGVPDMQGSQGSFTFFTSDETTDQTSRGGTIRCIDHPGKNVREIELQGPPNPFLTDTEHATVPMNLSVDNRTLQIQIQGQDITVNEGEWSDWVSVEFSFVGPISAKGQVRFFLRSAAPTFELYCSPVNVSSDKPAFPISYPETYTASLSSKIGPFHTLGMTADTGMLKEGRVDNVTFLEQAQTVLDERVAMLKRELSEFTDGMFTLVFDIPDRIQHMFWRYRDPNHARYNEKEAHQYGDVIKQNYRRMDEILGWVNDQLHPNDDLVVCSDHGFGTFRRQVDLNTWLVQNGYMAMQDGTRPSQASSLFQGVNWSETRAYAIGMSGIYLNIEGRERHGAVVQSEADTVAKNLIEDLQTLVDNEYDTRPISRIVRSESVYRGGQTDDVPDLLVGYNRGYRVSWDSVLGGMNGTVLSDNTNPWSGDHCFDPALVPGTLMANFSFDNGSEVGLWDIMPGLFARLDLLSDADFDGSSDWLSNDPG